ncbi:MAG TPA: ATP-dependent metallopeptidase FtsH/Yme1/Tma family protein [Chloroflexi bacterium]|nr:ATP-dependent metallopeptidase FtsH/Yme1/Tma family protein [Chloroflexota bacterium]
MLVFVGIIILVFYAVRQQAITSDEISISEVAEQIMDGKVSRVVVNEDELTLIYPDDTEGTSQKESGATLTEQLKELGVTAEYLSTDNVIIDIKPPSMLFGVLNVLGYILPFIMIAGLFWFVFRQARGGGSAAMNFGQSRARKFTGDNPTVTFDDVAGIPEAKEELFEVVEFLQEPEKFMALGARIPKGLLLMGAPGTGKTLLAKAVSGEAGVPFYSISGSEFVEMFVGVGASRVRDLFEKAKSDSPCIVFVDEIDAVGRHRGAGLGGSHDEREQTLNQILVEMDGFDTDTNVIIIAATNRPDVLDPALLRPGRFDRRVILDRPDMRGREAILEVHARGKPLAPDVDLKTLAKATPGFVGADLENMINEAAILAARREKKVIEQTDFQESIERVIAGPERKSRLISDVEKQIIAYHEAGHAITARSLPEADSVHKISIIARGQAGGYTLILPETDRTLVSRKKMLADMISLLGGRAAEEIVFSDITSGASNDLERVTKLAREMVTRLGMSTELGPMVYGQKDEMVFLGKEFTEQRDYSESVAEKIDIEVKQLVWDAYARAKEILVEYRDVLDKLAEKLLEQETIEASELDEIFPVPEPKNGGMPVKNSK